MAALESTKFVRFALPPSNPPLCNRNIFGPNKASRSIPLSTSRQKTPRPAAILSRSGCQAEDRNAAAKGEERKLALDNSDESDDDLPSLEELFQTIPPVSSKGSRTEPTFQYLEQAALHGVEMQSDRTKSGLSERQGDRPDQPMILDDDSDEASTENEAENGAGDIETRRTGRDTSPYSTPGSSELASGPWYDIEEGRYIDEPAPKLGSCEQQSVPSAFAPDELQIPLQSTLLQNEANKQNKQDIDGIAQSMSVEGASHSLPETSNNGDDGWTDNSMAELEKELWLALEKQVDSSLANSPSLLLARSAEAPQDKIKSGEHAKASSSRPEELQDASRNSTPTRDFEEQEQQETQVEVETLKRMELWEKELVGNEEGIEMRQQEELGWPATGDLQNLVAVDHTDNFMDTQLWIDKHCLRLRGKRTQQLAGRQSKTTQYHVVWGERPNRSDLWVNEADIRMSILLSHCERSLHGLVSHVRVQHLRRSRRDKSRKVFEYLFDDLSTWVTEDQLSISLSHTLLARLEASSTDSLSRAQSKTHPQHPAALTNDEHCYTSRISRSSFSPPGLVQSGDPETEQREGKRGHQDTHILTSSETHHSVNIDDDHNICDTGDESPRPAKRRKPRAAPVTTPTTCRRHTSELRLRQHSPQVGLSTTSPEIGDVQIQEADNGCPSTFVNNSHRHVSRPFPSPSAATEEVLFAEYQEWPFQGFLKCTKVGNETTYNFEFKLPSISGHFHLPIGLNASDNNHDAAAHSKMHQAPLQIKKQSVEQKSTRAAACRVPPVTLQAKRTRIPWTAEESEKILEMKKEGYSWEKIGLAFRQQTSQRTLGAIKMQYYTKLT
ncbi:hypothetical protein B0O99DRAFT_690798 [Bisporella sp. PMI_857]|nr:hypothetical protein B0O99DRAFT_690798 [Bisporella sp. PMI_857]